MKPSRSSILSMLDHTVRWTGFPGRVVNAHSSSDERKHQPTRWIPIWPIAFSCALFILSLTWPSALDGVPLGGIIGITVAFWGSIMAMVPVIHMNGPLGKPSLEDDEREAALRKDSFLFCLGLLAVLNGLGQPILMILSHWQNWHIAHRASVVASALMLNASLFGSLPTLYASWKLRQLPKESEA